MSETRDHLEALHRMMPKHLLTKFMLDYGREYTIGPDSFAGPRGVAKACFMNATNLAIGNPDLTYVEGKVSIYGVPIEHAWCATADGIVVDPTMEAAMADGTYARISDYFGVPFRTDYVRKAALTNRVYGLLDLFHAPKTMPKLVELGLEAGQRWLLDGKRKAVRRGR